MVGNNLSTFFKMNVKKIIDLNLAVRELQENDCEGIAKTFLFPWVTLEASIQKWKKYFSEQKIGKRQVFICEKNNIFIGYGSLLYPSEYPPFCDANIPEINDVWIEEHHRGQGIGTALISHIEDVARSKAFKKIGIGVGLYRDYGAAQTLYCKLGYIPDGKGVTYQGKAVKPGERYPVDDDLILWFIKAI